MNAENVSVVITTILRNNALLRLIDSIEKHWSHIPRRQVVVVDQNKRSESVDIRPLGYRQIEVPYDCGLSEARNVGLSCVDTEAFVLLEDDMQVREDTNLGQMLGILDTREVNGVAGAVINNGETHCPYEGDLSWEGDDLLFTVAPDGCRDPHEVDAVSNFFVGFTDDFAGIWDARFKVWEHLDFALHCFHNDYAWAWHPGAKINHFPHKPTAYKALRVSRVNHFRMECFKKWAIKRYETVKATDAERWMEGRRTWQIT